MLENNLRDMIDAGQHLKHADSAIEATCKASEDFAEPVSFCATSLTARWRFMKFM
jgi:hypothetical protein